jgi:hypothetical protein
MRKAGAGGRSFQILSMGFVTYIDAFAQRGVAGELCFGDKADRVQTTLGDGSKKPTVKS